MAKVNELRRGSNEYFRIQKVTSWYLNRVPYGALSSKINKSLNYSKEHIIEYKSAIIRIICGHRLRVIQYKVSGRLLNWQHSVTDFRQREQFPYISSQRAQSQHLLCLWFVPVSNAVTGQARLGQSGPHGPPLLLNGVAMPWQP